MQKILAILFTFCLTGSAIAQTRTIHVFVALCDNENQGIVPVPESLGNGQNPRTNLYWGAAYGMKTFFKNKTSDWNLVKTVEDVNNPNILERVLFKHATENVYLLADAYDGRTIENCTIDFLKASNGQGSVEIIHNSQKLSFGGQANLLAYVGHDGLMEFSVDIEYKAISSKPKDVMILACDSKTFFAEEIRMAEANPILWTTQLMAPEAYSLKSAIDGWIKNESGNQIDERAAQAYNKFQKCGINGARNLFTTGF